MGIQKNKGFPNHPKNAERSLYGNSKIIETGMSHTGLEISTDVVY